MSLERVILCGLVILYLSSWTTQSSFFLAKQYGNNNYVCVTNSSSALSWIQEDITEKLYPVSTYIPEPKPEQKSSEINCDIKNDDKTTRYFVKKPWQLQSSLQSYINQPVLDARWEEMEVVKTEFVEPNYVKLKYKLIQKTVVKDDSFDIPFSIRIRQDGHIYLCDGEYPPKARCYWFMLQAFGGNASAIRKCEKDYIPTKHGDWPQAPCKERRVYINHTIEHNRYLSSKKWSHFILSKRNNILALKQFTGHKDTKIMEWRDDGTPIDVTHMIVHSKIVNGLWKIHNIDFIYTIVESSDVNLGPLIYGKNGFVCISMYIAMCSSCKLKLSLVADKAVVTEEIFEIKHAGWTQIKFITENAYYPNGLKLLVSTIGTNQNAYWAIDKIRSCQRQEFRMIGLSEEAPCQLISDPERIAKYMSYSTINSNTNCPEDTVGDFCVKCDWIFENCEQITICNEQQCVCSAGYRDHSDYYGTTTCYSECPDYKYGHGCQKNCGKCPWSRSCNKIDGTCPRGQCTENYSGPKCDIPPATIFANPPKITEISYTEATVEVSNFDLGNSLTDQTPQYYTIEYKKAEATNTDWNHTNNQFHQFNMPGTFKLTNLEPETQYFVRSVIIDQNGQWQHGDDQLKFSEFTTSCEEISDNNIKIAAFNTTARIRLLLATAMTCKSYSITLFEKPETGVSNNSGTFFTDLLPYNNYTVKVSGKNKTHEKKFRTDEGVPTSVLSLTTTATSATSVNLMWTEPQHINGAFRHFVVNYQLISYQGCDATSSQSSVKSDKKIKGTTVTITDLIPYSMYEFTVFAVNTKFSGPPTSQKAATFSSEKIQSEEIPNIININATHVSANIELSKIKCENIRGPLMVEVTTKCTSECCQSQHRNSRTEQTRFPDTAIVQVDNLESFSDYDLELKFCRDDGSCSEPQKRKFKTETTVPRKVTDLLAYTKNTSTISLRWKPPYPPTGILKEYKIVWTSYRNKINQEIAAQITPCRLWPELHCATLAALPSEVYIIMKIYAKNKHPIEFGEFAEIRKTTKIEKSSAPYDLNINWTPQNNLQVEWKHPNETNGDISYFGVQIRSADQPGRVAIQQKFNVSRETYNLTYRYMVNGLELQPTKPYIINVYAVNDQLGDAVVQRISTPPDVPTLSTDADFTSSNDSFTISVSPQKLRGSTDTYRLFVLRPDEQSNLELYQNILKYDLNKDLKVVVDCDVSQILDTFEIYLGSDQQHPSCIDIDNAPLQPAATYNITIVLLNVFRNESRANIYSYTLTTPGDPLIYTRINSTFYGLFVLLIVIPLVVFFIIKWYRNKNMVSCLHTRSTSNDRIDCQANAIPLVEPKQSKQKNNRRKSNKNMCGAPNHYSKIINRKDFENYAKKSFENQELKHQHEAILETISTYETVREMLRSEYIDMNYTSGLKIKEPYVATKIPSVGEYEEFWKIIWLENISHIILFEDIHTNDRTCFEPYWPKLNSIFCYEDVTVECTTNEDHQSYQQRKLTIKFKNKSRQVEQLHFSLKSDDKFYLSSLNYAHFFQKMTKIPHSSESPILVHSSSGMRGTSFALLCDISLRTATKDGAIDVMANLKNLTQCNPEMMIDYDHYVAAHAVIVDILRHVDTTINCSFFDVNKRELFRKDEIQKHFQYLQDTVWLDRINIESDDERYIYNRYISPGSEQLESLSSEDTDSSLKQFNIIKVNGFKAPKKFLLVQDPKANPLSDFLSLVQDQQVSVIVTLNENIFSWPCENDPVMDINTNVKLEHQVTRNLKTYDWITVKLTTQSKIQTVEIISFKNWCAPIRSLPNVQNFTNFVSESNEIFKNVETVLITDCGNVTASGLYIAATYIIQKIKTESICDVCTSVRILRRHSENFGKTVTCKDFYFICTRRVHEIGT